MLYTFINLLTVLICLILNFKFCSLIHFQVIAITTFCHYYFSIYHCLSFHYRYVSISYTFLFFSTSFTYLSLFLFTLVLLFLSIFFLFSRILSVFIQSYSSVFIKMYLCIFFPRNTSNWQCEA